MRERDVVDGAVSNRLLASMTPQPTCPPIETGEPQPGCSEPSDGEGAGQGGSSLGLWISPLPLRVVI